MFQSTRSSLGNCSLTNIRQYRSILMQFTVINTSLKIIYIIYISCGPIFDAVTKLYVLLLELFIFSCYILRRRKYLIIKLRTIAMVDVL
jgi:hypothetical protein